MTEKKPVREGNIKQIHNTMKKPEEKYGKLERPFKNNECKLITEIEEQRNRWQSNSKNS